MGLGSFQIGVLKVLLSARPDGRATVGGHHPRMSGAGSAQRPAAGRYSELNGTLPGPGISGSERATEKRTAALKNIETHSDSYGSMLARQMLSEMPELIGKGICVTVVNGVGEIVSVLPFDCLN
jgi:hypothetical protein